MDWQQPRGYGMPEDGWIPVRDLTATFSPVDLTGWLVDRPAGDPRGALGHREPPAAVRTDEVTNGLRVITDWVGDAVIVRAIGEVDARNADGLASALRAGWEAAGPPGSLVVDLSGAVFFSVAGLALLITTEQQCRDRELSLRLVATGGALRALRVTGLDVLFDITSTVVSAIRPRENPEWTVRKRQ